ncbi:hypothetical protein Q7P35_005335 [Cladosporium inversicolor]
MPTIRSIAFALSAVATQLASAKDWDSPQYKYLFEYPMPIAPIKAPKETFQFPNGPNIEYYEVDIKTFEQQVYPNLGKTKLVGYDGMAPGPTFMVKKGTEAVVRFINHGEKPNSVHLHGSYSRAPFDGWADDTTEVGQYKDYYYPNAQNARTLWYHDHAIEHTAENAYMGQAGFYIMHDDEELAVPGLPQGEYDIPMALTSKRYNNDGTLWSPEKNGEDKNLFGDVVHVNGQPWPYFKVEPRKYRLRFLNAAISRSWELYFESAAKAKVNMKVVGSDAGLLTKPVDTTQLDISMAERWEVVVDFSAFKNQNVTLKSNAKVADVDPYLHTDKVMRFVVGSTVTSTAKNEALPATLRTVPFPPTSKVSITPLSSNAKAANGRSTTHPIHIHLVDFQIVSRTGTRGVRPYEKEALKDVVWLNTNEEVNVIARYAPWDGLYMTTALTQSQFHCHNLIHEDHEMMAAMNVTALADLGYDEKTTFIDPMEQRYRAKGFAGSDFTGRSGDFTDAAIKEKVKFFNDLDAYRNVLAVESRLEDYWKTASSGSDSSSSSSSVSSSTLAAVSGTTLATSASTTAVSDASTPAAGAGSSSVASATTSSAPAATVSSSAITTSKATSTTKKADDKTTKKTTTTTKK